MNFETLRLCTARAVPLESTHSGGIPEITASDVAAALAGANQETYDLAAYKYLLDESVMPRLLHSAHYITLEIAQKERWQPPRGREFLRIMTKIAFFEVVERSICKVCSGTGSVSARACKHCQGSGQDRATDTSIAIALGLHPATYHNRWRRRYAMVKGGINDWAAELERSALKRLKKERRTP